MKKWIQRKEKGQVLLILMIGVTALLAFTALAIDTGQFYSDRRYDQNVADGSAFAGGGAAGNTFVANEVTYSNFNCNYDSIAKVYTDPDVQAAVDAAIAEAQSRAAVNNFATLPAFETEAELIAAGHGVWIECVVEGTYLGDKYLAVHVMVTSYVQTAFAHMFFGSSLRNTVEAVTKVEVPEGVGRGLAIVALNEDGCGGNDGGLFFTGTGTVTISDSGAHSNACLDCSGTATVSTDGGSFPLTYLLPPKGTQCENINPVPTTADGPIDRTYLDMTGLCGPAQTVPAADLNGVITISPGTYPRIRVNNVNETLKMQPGLYCVNGDFTVNGKGIEVSTYTLPAVGYGEDDALDYEGVTIYAIGGAVTINGTSSVLLVAPKMIPGANPGDPKTDPPASVAANAIPGMLFYIDPANPKPTVTINGGAITFVRGTILNPDGTVTINGNSDNDQWYAQVVADEIFLGGTATLNITYNGDDFYWGEAFLGLEK